MKYALLIREIFAVASLLAILTSGQPARAASMLSCERSQSDIRIEACTELLKSEQNPQKRSAIFLKRGEAYKQLRQTERAIQDYQAAVDANPRSLEAAHALWQRGWLFLSLQNYGRARDDADRLVALGGLGTFLSGHQLLCRALHGLRQFEQAIQACSEQIRLGGALRSQHYWERGDVYLSAGRLDEALADFDEALKDTKNSIWAKLGRGTVMFAKGDYTAALAEFDQANNMSLANGYPWSIAIGKRGLANEALGRHREAIADFKKVLQLSPNCEKSDAPRVVESCDESRAGLVRLGISPETVQKPWWRFW